MLSENKCFRGMWYVEETGLGIHRANGHRSKSDCMGLVKLPVSRFLRIIIIDDERKVA